MIATVPEIVQHYLAQAGEGAGAPQLAATRRAALARFAHLGFPTTKQEGWRSTPIGEIATTPFALPGRFDVPASALEAAGIADWPGARGVVVNGRYAPGLSQAGDLPAGEGGVGAGEHAEDVGVQGRGDHPEGALQLHVTLHAVSTIVLE